MSKKDFVISLKHTLVKYKGKDKHIVIPDGVTKIGQYAFRGCENHYRNIRRTFGGGGDF